MSAWQPGHRPSQSSISSLSYPLSPALVARLQSSFLLSGLTDALQYKSALESIQTNPFIRSQVTKCSLLQAFILVCVLSVDWLLLPAWTRDAGRESASSRTRLTEEQARFYFQVCSKHVISFSLRVYADIYLLAFVRPPLALRAACHYNRCKQIFWLYPLVGISFLVSGSFFSNVASGAAAGDVPQAHTSRGSGRSSPVHK